MAVYNCIEWDRTSACEGASGCCYQSIFDLTHPPNPCMKCEMKLEIDHHTRNFVNCSFPAFILHVNAECDPFFWTSERSWDNLYLIGCTVAVWTLTYSTVSWSIFLKPIYLQYFRSECAVPEYTSAHSHPWDLKAKIVYFINMESINPNWKVHRDDEECVCLGGGGGIFLSTEPIWDRALTRYCFLPFVISTP